MAELHKKPYFKLIVWIVLIVTIAVSVVSAGEIALALCELYEPWDGIKDTILTKMAEDDMRHLSSYIYFTSGDEGQTLHYDMLSGKTKETYSYLNSNFGYAVYDMNGDMIAGCSDIKDGSNIELVACSATVLYSSRYGDE